MSATEVREWRHDDAETRQARAEWDRGPWDDEPDKIQWVDAATNLDCLMHRNRMGAWCGYVGLAEGHPYFGVGYSECSLTPPCGESYCEHSPDVEVHGGLTYADFCQETVDEARGICHVPFDGRPHRVWWLGFDCLHHMDSAPGMDASNRKWGLRRDDGHYRTRNYVEREVARLAAQLAVARVERPPVTEIAAP